MPQNDHYNIEKFKALSLAKITRLVGIPQKRLQELLFIEAVGDKEWLTKEEAIKIINSGIPIEPFIVGTKRWEELRKKEIHNNSILEEEITLLIADSIKEKTKNFEYPLNEDAYRLFLRYRIDFHNKKVSKKGAETQKGKLRRYPVEIQEAMVKKAIDKRWESIFDLSEAEIKNINNQTPQPHQSRQERILKDDEKSNNTHHLSFEDMINNFEKKENG